MKKTDGGWPKASKEMSDLLAAHVSSLALDKRVMFGAPVYFVNGNMLAGVFADKVFVRLSSEDRERLSRDHGAATFEPVKGRRMAEYMVLPDEVVSDGAAFELWLHRSYDYGTKLPAKKR